MKKNLNEIFDGATPHELDVLSEELHAKELPPETLNAVKQKVYAKTKLSKKSTNKVWTRIGALAACFALILGAVIIGPMLKGDGPVTPPDDPNDSLINPPIKQPPSVSTMVSGNKLTGKQELLYGEYESETEGNYDMIPPGFGIHTVVEAEVIEVLPDTYYFAASYYLPFHVARLRVIDQIRGEGLPEEIYLLYPYYDTDVFDGYERFVFGLSQVGVENYLLVNQTQGRLDYFSNMFEVAGVRDLGYGSVIAFNDGRVDESFFEKVEHFTGKIGGAGLFDHFLDDPEGYRYPAGRDSTVAEVKANVLALVERFEYADDCDYVTADDIFVSEEAKQIRAYLEPSENNAFAYTIYVREDRVIARYTRVINGFLTNEQISINGYDGENGNVRRDGESFTPEDLAKTPDIGEAMASLNLSELQPPHIELSEYMTFKYLRGQGFYRKVEGEVYGIVRLQWHYSCFRQWEDKFYYDGYVMDDCYYLYDSEGNGRIMEREELREVIGDDRSIIFSFPYNGRMWPPKV